MEKEDPIKVQIMDSEYRVACPPDERDALLVAADYLNDTMQGIRNTGKVLGVERIAVMAALNICYELLDTQKQAVTLETAINDRIQKFIDNIDSVLATEQQSEV